MPEDRLPEDRLPKDSMMIDSKKRRQVHTKKDDIPNMKNIPIEYEHEGLTQKTHFQYHVVYEKRVSSIHQNCKYIRKLDFQLPLFLTLPVWKRHRYTFADIKKTLSSFSSEYIWQLALLLGIPLCSSAVKSTFHNSYMLVFGSKAVAIRKIMLYLHTNESSCLEFKHSVSTLDNVRDEHVPPLPIHQVTDEFYHILLHSIPETPIYLLKPIHVKTIFKWCDIFIVAMSVDREAIYCVRVVLLSTFRSSRKYTKVCMSTEPLIICVDGLDYAGLDEAMFFVKS